MSSVACHHRPWIEIHSRTTTGMACNHGPWPAHAVDQYWRGRPSLFLESIHRVRRRREWHAIISLRHHTQLEDVARGMLSSLLDCTHGRTMLGMAMLSSPLGSTHSTTMSARVVGLCRAWHDIIAIVQHTLLDNVRRDVPYSLLDNTHGGTMSGMSCNHQTCIAYTVGRRRAWDAIMTLGKHTQLDYVGCGRPLSPLDSIHMAGQRWAWHSIIALRQHTRSDDVGLGVLSWPLDCTHGRTMFGVAMLSLPLGSTHGRMTLGVICNHCILDNHMVGRHRRWALNSSIAFRQQTWINDVESGMPSSPLGSTCGRTRSGMTCNLLLWLAHTYTHSVDVGHGMPTWPLGSTNSRMTWSVECHHLHWAAHVVRSHRCDIPSSPLDSTHGGKMSGVACHHWILTIYTVGLRQAWHAIMDLVKHTLSYDVECGTQSSPLKRIHIVRQCRTWHPSSPLDNIHDRTTSGVACYHFPWTTHTVGRHLAWQCYHRPWAAYTIGRRRALNSIIALWITHIVRPCRRGMPS
ncbi:hypothetical protein EJD97_008050 [Solanum chilense]|uniref:Uncharacterized protein n=1 Tax=Solanum chilense TaxID=4083 RepID=A0A6N2APA4_SOLCI|nr:hypothetical protein EJD97_008050 [Solanum chilense]